MATTVTLSDKDIRSLADQIKTADVPASAKDEFCKVWKDADPILKAVEDVVGTIPGWGAILKGAIAIVVSIGEAASKALDCPARAGTRR